MPSGRSPSAQQIDEGRARALERHHDRDCDRETERHARQRDPFGRASAGDEREQREAKALKQEATA